MPAIHIDALLPSSLIGESVDVRRRARLIVYACGIAVLIDVITPAFMPTVLWLANPVAWALVHIGMHLPTLLVLRKTRSIAWASHYFIAIVFVQSALQLEVSNGFSAFGFIAVPVAAAHLVGRRATSLWTPAAIAAALVLPILLGLDSRVFGICGAVATITLAIGIASIIVESTRARATRDMEVAEGSMRLQRERLRAFVEQTFPCLAEVQDGALVFVSESVKELFDYSPAEILALNTALVRPEDVAMLRRHVSATPSARTRAEIRVRRRDGRWIWLEVFATPFGETARDERWLFAARDIDDEMRHRERVEQAQRLEGIGALAAGIAHDFNNLLTAIFGFGSRLPASEARDQVLDAAGSAAELTAQLLAFGRSGPRIDALIDPARELQSLEPMIRSLLGEEFGLAIRGSAEGAAVRIAPGRFKQVMLNLVTNAKEARHRRGHERRGAQARVRSVLLDQARASRLWTRASERLWNRAPLSRDDRARELRGRGHRRASVPA